MSEMLTVADIAAELKVDPKTIRRAIHSGGLRAFQVGKATDGTTWRVSRDDLDAWLQERSNDARLAQQDLDDAEPVDPPASTVRPLRRRVRSRAAAASPGTLAVTPEMGRRSA